MTTRNVVLATAFMATTMAAAPAAAEWAFTQVGFDDGGVLTGSFSGTDTNLDGWLTSSDGEITNFEAMFTGDQRVPAFVLARADLGGFAFRIGNATLGADAGPPTTEGLFASSSSFAILAGLGATGTTGAWVVDLTTGADASSTQPLNVSAVPEPGTVSLMALGLACGATSLRRQRPRRSHE